MYFDFASKKSCGLPLGADAIDLRIGKNGSVDSILAVDCERVNFEAGQFGKNFGFSVLRKCIDLGGCPGGCAASIVERSLGVLGDGPEVGYVRAVQFLEFRRQRDVPSLRIESFLGVPRVNSACSDCSHTWVSTARHTVGADASKIRAANFFMLWR